MSTTGHSFQLYTQTFRNWHLKLSNFNSERFSLLKHKQNMDISKATLAVTFKYPQTLDNPHSRAQSSATALTCPSHIDSPPRGPNQFLLFSDPLPAWSCSGRQRNPSIRPGWLWLMPPNDPFVSLFSFSSFLFLLSVVFSSISLSLSLSPSLHSLAMLLQNVRHVEVTVQSLFDLGDTDNSSLARFDSKV